MYNQWGWYSRWWTRWYRYFSIEISPSCTTSGGGTVGGGQVVVRYVSIEISPLCITSRGGYSRWWTRWYRYVSIEISPSCTTSGGGTVGGGQGGTGMFR